jgi:hypothetical protein
MSVRQRRPRENGNATYRDTPSSSRNSKPASAEGGLAVVTASYIILVRRCMGNCSDFSE